MKHRGFTLIEILVVMAIVALLASLAAPRYIASVKRGQETALRGSLAVMRDAIDQFAADKGRYPESLEELVAQRYLRALPEDPIAQSRGNWISVPPPEGASLEGAMYDVRSGAAGRGANGVPYGEW